MKKPRISIFVGHFGSGKTELAINYALYLKEIYPEVALVDLDVIKPYFRSREQVEFLEKAGIKLIYPKELHYADLPIVPAEVQSLLQDENKYGVIDVGGDEKGATALASVSSKLKKHEYDLSLVVNNYRMATNSLEKIREMKDSIQLRSRLEINSLVCNPNLGAATTVEHVIQGYQLIKKAANSLELPIKFVVIKEDLLKENKNAFAFPEAIFPLKRYLKPPWER